MCDFIIVNVDIIMSAVFYGVMTSCCIFIYNVRWEIVA